MNKQSLTVLLIEDSPDYADLVEDWLSGDKKGLTTVLNWTDSLQAGLKRLAKGGVDVILLDLGLPDSNGAETFRKVKAAAAGIPLIVLSSADSEALALEMIREGAEDYLVKNTCTAEALVRALQYAVLRHRSHIRKPGASAGPDQGRAVGFLGAKGGVGTTTVACTFAAELRAQTNDKVLLADFDVDRGLVAFLTGLEPKYTLADAVENLNRLDITCWESIVSSGADGLDIVPSPVLLGADGIEAGSLVQVFETVLPFYPWVVVDLGAVNASAMQLLDKMHEVFLVTGTGITTLYQTKRVIGGLIEAGVEQDRIRLIVNQMESGQGLSGSDLNRIFGIPVHGTLPASRDEIYKASIERRLPPEASSFRKELAKLTRKLAGLSEQKPKRSFMPFRASGAKLHANLAKS